MISNYDCASLILLNQINGAHDGDWDLVNFKYEGFLDCNHLKIIGGQFVEPKLSDSFYG